MIIALRPGLVAGSGGPTTGAIVQSGETVLTLTIDRPMRIRAYIPEPALSRISPGMNVTVTTDGLANKTLVVISGCARHEVSPAS